MTSLDVAISEGKRLGKMALYFGCWHRPGHFLHTISGDTLYKKPDDLPWDDDLMDTNLLKNGKVPDFPDGRVFWCAGGNKAFWYAFYWWDRSVDTRGACNSGLYVRGFGWGEMQAAFEYGCTQFPHVIKRQKYPLVLQNVGSSSTSDEHSCDDPPHCHNGLCRMAGACQQPHLRFTEVA